MNLLANIFGWVLHPVLLTVPAVFLISYYSTGDIQASYYWTVVSLIFTAIVSIFVLIGVRRGFFNNIDVSNRKQRVILYPFSVVVVLCFAFFVYVQKGPVALVLSAILFVFALIVMDAINTRIKASVHVAAVSAIVIGLVFMYGGFAYWLVLLIPMVAWVRIYKKRHTLRETIVGAICGASFTLGAIYIVQLLQ